MNTTTATAPQPTKVITGRVRFSYVHVFEAAAVSEGDEKKFSANLIISKDDKEGLAKIQKAIDAAVEIAKGKNKGKLPAKFKMPLRDGDEEKPEDEAYENSYFLNATSKTKPGVVDKDTNPILDQDEFYSGCYGRASINFYYFDVKGNKGIAAGLNNVQKLKDGEPLGGRQSAEADFAEPLDGVEDDDDLM